MESLSSLPTLDEPDSDPPTDLDPDLAAQMGFASFGAQPTAKKRKYNPAADAVTSFLPPTHAGLPNRPPLPVGTGANSGALGKVRNGQNGWLSERGYGAAQGEKRYAEGGRGMGRDRVLGGGGRRGRGGRGGGERSWGDGEGASGSNRTPLGTRGGLGGEHGAVEGLEMRIGAGTCPQWREDEKEEEDDDMPGYVDSTPPGSPLPRTGEISHPTNDTENSPIDGEAAPERSVEEEIEEADADAGSGPPARPPASSGRPESLPVRTQQSGSRGAHYDWNALRKGVRNEKGDMVYYDASFVEDAWTDLVRGGRAVAGQNGSYDNEHYRQEV
ncbi:hypothetical protein MMC15_005723 [Xylographa vitiligo]|nr:hypothetical protein [Xylographa vitiligo]